MDVLAGLAGVAACVAFWILLTKSMKINGMSGWWRHLSAAFWSPFAFLGGSMLIGSLLGLTDSEGNRLGAAGAIGGIAVLMPLIFPLGISWRGAKRKLASSAAASSPHQPIITPERASQAFVESPPEPAPVSEPSSKPESVDKQPSPEPLTTTEQAPIGAWLAVDSALVEFEYQSEEEPIVIYAARVCDTHVAGALEGENFDAVEREYAFSGFKSAVTLPLEDSLEVPVDQLCGYLLANYPDDLSDDDSAWEEEPPTKEVESVPSATGNLRFVYRDADGNESTRELTNFKMSAGKVRGICLDRNAIRTFRLERIVEFLEGEEQLYATKAKPRSRPEMPDAVRSGNPEITFSGFDAKTRASLEKTAQAHGFVVRKSVTKNLDYFVAGQRRSGAKLVEAEEKPGCSVIDKEGFLWLVATGEVATE
ncbi:hypothetical protein QT231_24065 [Halomonas sp. SpR1]|uniref:BRCT domain-containing protein n=1 Tax=Halomonas sp. SpR1 TaxID=3050462 RepID=UPI0027E54552|nr:BRCT domain-containing protein [Halomonas sp. SpR1]MDQ7735780.1 hypothetical protein [Halomonas sp. SpR1]